MFRVIGIKSLKTLVTRVINNLCTYDELSSPGLQATMNGRMRIPVSSDGYPALAWRLPWWTAAGAIALAAGVLAWPLSEAGAQDRLAGPVPAEVLSVIDGDTIEVRAVVWLGQVVSTRVRLAGIDAPELRAKCARERALAERARAYLLARLEGGDRSRVRLRDIRYGKYAGRVLARV